MAQSRPTVPHLLLPVLLLLHLPSHAFRDVKLGCLLDGTSCATLFLLLERFVVRVDAVGVVITRAEELKDEVFDPWPRTHDMKDDVSKRRVGARPCNVRQSLKSWEGKEVAKHALGWKIPKGLDAYMSAISWSMSIVRNITRKVQ
jgi:hypothetical protein